MPAKKPTFEEAMERLEVIVSRLEQGDAPLEEAMALFEEGAKLSALCYNTLDRAELKISELSSLQPEEASHD